MFALLKPIIVTVICFFCNKDLPTAVYIYRRVLEENLKKMNNCHIRCDKIEDLIIQLKEANVLNSIVKIKS